MKTSIRRLPYAAAGVALAVVTAATLMGCGESRPPGADASIDELATAFAPCDREIEPQVPAHEFIAETWAWLNVTGVITADRDGDGPRKTLPAVVAVSASSLPERATTEARVAVHNAHWPGVDWALANDAQVWFGLLETDPALSQGTEGIVGTVMVVLRSGQVFFPGECQHSSLYEPLADRYGAEMDAILAQAPRYLGEDLRRHLGIESAPTGSGEVVFLNPQDAPADLLATLRLAIVHITLSQPLGHYVICTKIAAGWNEGYPATSRIEWINAYLDEGPLEFWLLDSTADVSKPVALLGSLTVPSSLATDPGPALRVEIDTAGLTGGDIVARGPSGVTVTLVEAIRGSELDFTDPDWPAFIDEPTSGEPAGPWQ